MKLRHTVFRFCLSHWLLSHRTVLAKYQTFRCVSAWTVHVDILLRLVVSGRYIQPMSVCSMGYRVAYTKCCNSWSYGINIAISIVLYSVLLAARCILKLLSATHTPTLFDLRQRLLRHQLVESELIDKDAKCGIPESVLIWSSWFWSISCRNHQIFIVAKAI